MGKEVLERRIKPGSAANESHHPVPLLDIRGENALIYSELMEACGRVLQSGRFVLGAEVEALEREIAELCGADQAIGCASGSDALLLALMALGIGPGDEVIVPSFTFFATASAVSRLGATPVFADIQPSSFNICPAAVKERITERTGAIIPVHLFGYPAEMSAINAIAAGHEIPVIEDAAQAIGATLDGRAAGSLADIGCFSFYPTKNLGAFGDGGMLTTANGQLAERFRLLRGHGMQPRYYHKEVGINSRLDALQAAMLRVKLPYLRSWTRKRQENAVRYRELFEAANLAEQITLPSVAETVNHVWNQFTIRVDDNRRDALRSHLSAAEIGTEIYYPIALHQQECFQHLAYSTGSLPETERAAAEVLSLPIHPLLTIQQQEAVVSAIERFFA